MSRFRDIVRGARARETVSVALDDGEMRMDLRLLSVDEETYDISLMAETVFAAARVVGGEDAFFDAASDVSSLDRDTIQYLYQAHALFTDRCSPRLLKMSPEEFVAGIAVLASEDSESIRFFERLGPGLQWIYTRTLARQAVTSQTLRSGSGSTSEAPGKA